MTYERSKGWHGTPESSGELSALIAHGRELQALAIGEAVGGLIARVRRLMP